LQPSDKTPEVSYTVLSGIFEEMPREELIVLMTLLLLQTEHPWKHLEHTLKTMRNLARVVEGLRKIDESRPPSE